MLADLRFALRQLQKTPGFTLVAVLSLALGIGANTTVFSLLNELLLRALPVREPARLVIFRRVAGEGGSLSTSNEGYGGRDPATGRQTSSSFSLLVFERFNQQTDVLSHVFAFAPFWQANVLINGQPDPAATAQMASGDYHAGLGVRAWVGRTFTLADDRPDAEPVAVISHRFWQRNFGGSADVVGRTIELNKVKVTVIGVTPENFAGASQAGSYIDVTVPLAHYLKFDPDGAERKEPWYWWIRIMARLAPGVTARQAEAKLAPVMIAAAREGWLLAPRKSSDPMPGDPTLIAEPGFQGENDERRQFTRPLQLMQGMVGLVLLAACANVANLLLARGIARRREIAVRIALGAGRGRLVRQLLGESLLLAAAAAVLGLIFAAVGRRLLIALHPFGAGVQLEVPLAGPVLGFTLAATLVTTLLFGLLPALRATKLDLTREFQGGRAAVGSRSLLSQALMVLQVALALLLLVSTGLVLRSLQKLNEVEVGFNRHSLAAFRIDTASAGYEPTRAGELRTRIQERLATLPGVLGVTYSRVAVLSRSRQTTSITLSGAAASPDAKPVNVHLHAVPPNFFAVTEQPLLLGRGFTEADNPRSLRVGLVNETFVRKYLNGANPIGVRFRSGPDKAETEIIGLARDAKYADLRSEVPPTVYLAFLQSPTGPANFLVRTQGDPVALFDGIRGAVREIDPTLPVLNLRTQDQQVDRLNQQEIIFAKLAGTFGVLVLILSAIGLSGLLSHSVARRTGEIGLRMALGALPGQVLALFLRESLALVAIGLGVGAVAAWGVTHLFTAMLFGLTAVDPLTYIGACLVLISVALLASLWPARRGARVDPLVALRTE
jgi:predicted permease